MKRAAAVLLLGLLSSGCSLLDALNPFSGSGPKMASLEPIQATVAARVLWQYDVGKSAGQAFVPAVVRSSVYAAAANGTIARLDDGQASWRIKAERPLSGGVAADERMLVVGSPKGEVLAFAVADGKLLWKTSTNREIIAPPVLAPGLVIVRSGDHRLTAYDAFDGKRKWIYQRPNPPLSLRVTAPPVLVDKYLFVGFPGGKLIALGLDNGAPLWEGTVALPKGATELDRIADVTSVPVIDGRTVCAAAYQGRVACFDLGSGNLMWTRDISSAAGLALDSRYVFVADDKGALHALDRASGASIWKQDKLFLRRLTAPLVVSGLLAVADVQGTVHFLNREDGSFAARVRSDGSPVLAAPQLSGTRDVILQTSAGSVLAIGVE